MNNENTNVKEQELDANALDDINGGVTAWVVITTAASLAKYTVKAGWELGKWAAKHF